MDIPVYLFTGFLEAGKTKFIQDTLTDVRFNNGESTLLMLCEEGEEEYNPKEFSGENVYIEEITPDMLNEKVLEQLRKKYRAERVIVEYNGMWQLSDLFENLPRNWIIAQEFMFADANTFESFNTNMRSLVFEKLSTCELVVFNRFNENCNKMALHKIVRGINRRCNIAYESNDGRVEYDDIKDPLPFDIDAPIIEIKDIDYALWYRDLTENLEGYSGKTVKFKGLVAKNAKVPAGSFVIGRPLMTCCADDIQYAGLICDWGKAENMPNKSWVMVTAKIELKKHKAYQNVGPVLSAISVAATTPPENQVAEFY